MKYKTLDDVLQALADDRPVSRDDVAARVLNRKVWVYGAGSPGCLYDSGPYYTDSKRNAVACLVELADNGEGTPRGVVTELRRSHCSYRNGWRYELSQDTLGGIL